MRSGAKSTYVERMTDRRCEFDAYLSVRGGALLRLSRNVLERLEADGELPDAQRVYEHEHEARVICVRAERWQSGRRLVDTMRLPLGTDRSQGAGGEYLLALGLMGGSALLDCRWSDEALMTLLAPMVPFWWDAPAESVQSALALSGASCTVLQFDRALA